MKSAVLLLSAVVVIASASPSCAVSPREAQALQLIVAAPDKTLFSFGPLRALVRHMKSLRQICDVAPYDRGVDISCAAPKQEPMVYLHFDAEPGPRPEVAYLSSLRINGRNGGETPAAQFLSAMTAFTHMTPRPAKF